MLLNSPAMPDSGPLPLIGDRAASFGCARAACGAGASAQRLQKSQRFGRVCTSAILSAVFCFAGLLGLGGSAAASEVVTLADNTQVAGKLTHYFDGVIVLETSNGQKIELPRDKVKAITFKLPPARAEFATPEKVFERWRQSMQKGDVNKAIDCYALMYQGQVGQQMIQTPDALKQAQKDMEGVLFELRGASYQTQGETKLATLKVRRTKGENVQTDEIHFVLENGEWKMTP